MPLSIILCVDGNGESQVVAIWFIKSESQQLSNMFRVFEHANNTEGTRCVMTDKDWVERGVKETSRKSFHKHPFWSAYSIRCRPSDGKSLRGIWLVLASQQDWQVLKVWMTWLTLQTRWNMTNTLDGCRVLHLQLCSIILSTSGMA